MRQSKKTYTLGKDFPSRDFFIIAQGSSPLKRFVSPWVILFYKGGKMEDLKYGDVTMIGITAADFISIEFYDPGQQDGQDFSTIYLDDKQIKQIIALGRIINGKTT